MSSVTVAARTGVATHYLRYLGSNVLVVAAGFVSFPVMARLLDNRQFGLLGYYEAWLLMLAGVLKLGTQHSILRFYPHGGDRARLAQFRSDQVLLPFGLSLLLWLGCVVIALPWLPSLPSDERLVVTLLLLSVPLIVWSSFVEALMYALERSDITLWLKSLWRWGELAAVVAVLVFVQQGAAGVLAAKAVVLVLVVIWLTRWLGRWLRAPHVRPTRTTAVAGLAFGLPMMFNELTSLMFGFADRILLRWVTGSLEQVGIYTVGYGLAMAVGMVLGATLNQTFTPTAVRLYETSGAAGVVALKRRMLDAWIIVAAVAAALLVSVGEDLLVVLAGPGKAASGPVFVLVATTLVAYSLLEIAQYGMLLQRRAVRHLVITLVATVFNLALNLPLIQAHGVMGAAWATAAAYALLALLQYFQCPRELRYLPPLPRVLVAIAFVPAFASLLPALRWLGADAPATRVLAAVAVVLPLAALVALADPAVRSEWRAWRRARGAAA